MAVSVVAKNTCTTVGEGPHWEERTKSLVYVDLGTISSDVHRWSSITSEDTSLRLGLIGLFVLSVSSHFAVSYFAVNRFLGVGLGLGLGLGLRLGVIIRV